MPHPKLHAQQDQSSKLYPILILILLNLHIYLRSKDITDYFQEELYILFKFRLFFSLHTFSFLRGVCCCCFVFLWGWFCSSVQSDWDFSDCWSWNADLSRKEQYWICIGHQKHSDRIGSKNAPYCKTHMGYKKGGHISCHSRILFETPQ